MAAAITSFQPSFFLLVPPLRSYCYHQPSRTTLPLRFKCSTSVTPDSCVLCGRPVGFQLSLTRGKHLFLKPKTNNHKPKNKEHKTMENRTQSINLPNWAELLIEAVT